MTTAPLTDEALLALDEHLAAVQLPSAMRDGVHVDGTGRPVPSLVALANAAPALVRALRAERAAGRALRLLLSDLAEAAETFAGSDAESAGFKDDEAAFDAALDAARTALTAASGA